MNHRPELIGAEAAREYWQQGRVQFVDARPRVSYERSRERIPGALHIEPAAGAGATDALMALPREKVIVAYCDDPGHAAGTAIARRVRALGMDDGCAITGGFAAWKHAGYPTEQVPAAIRHTGQATGAAHHFVERTPAGALVTARAPSLQGVLTESALGLADALGAPQRVVAAADHFVTVNAPDETALLHAWATALMMRTTKQRRLFVEFEIDQLGEGQLRARARSADVAAWYLGPRDKALVLSRLQVRPDGFEAQLTIEG